jgi:hypothetical protein
MLNPLAARRVLGPLAEGIASGPTVVTEGVVWTGYDPTKCSAVGSTLTQIAGASGWYYGGTATKRLQSGDGYVDCASTYQAGNSGCSIGLSLVDVDGQLSTIKWAISWGNNSGIGYSQVNVYEFGVSKAGVSASLSDMHLRVSIVSGVVKYYYGAVGSALTLLYTSLVAPEYPLLVDSSLYAINSDAKGATINGIWS